MYNPSSLLFYFEKGGLAVCLLLWHASACHKVEGDDEVENEDKISHLALRGEGEKQIRF